MQNAPPFVAQAVMASMLSPVLLGSEQLMGELMSQLPRAAGRRIVPEPTIGQSWRGYSEESVSDARCLQGTDEHEQLHCSVA